MHILVTDSQEPEVKFVYRASDEYGMSDLSAASFDDFVNRFTSFYYFLL